MSEKPIVNPETFEVEVPKLSYNPLINEKLVKLQQLRDAFTFLTSKVVRFDDQTYTALYLNLRAEFTAVELYLASWADAKAKGENV